MRTPQLSIVIPAYNEANRLPATLAKIEAYLRRRDLEAEVIVVDDGSTDSTASIATSLIEPLADHGRVLRNLVNLGKGASVRRGMLAARGARILFTDADLSTPIEDIEKLERMLDAGAAVAIGSRALDRQLIEKRQPWPRDLTGRLFNLVVRLFAVRGILDTQCGFKLFTAEVAGPIFAQTRIDRFGFDVEVLAIAVHLGVSISEVPVRWRNHPDTRVTLGQGARAFLDPLRVGMGMALGRYSVGRLPLLLSPSSARQAAADEADRSLAPGVPSGG